MTVNDIVIEFEDKQKMIIEGCQTLLVYPDQGFAEVTKNGYKMYFNFNKIRLKECKKIKTYEQYDEAYKLFVDDSCLWGIWLNKCDNCECDDFGYCLLNDDKYDGYAELNYCLPALIEKLEDGLQRLMKK